MGKRLGSAVIGLGLIALVVWLGFRSFGGDARIVALYGLAGVFAGPAGMSLLWSGIRGGSGDEIRIRKASKLEELARDAEAAELKARHLDEFVAFEARKLVLERRNEIAEGAIARALEELRTIRNDAAQLQTELPKNLSAEEYAELAAHLAAQMRGEVLYVFGHPVMLPRSVVQVSPAGEMLYELLRWLSRLQARRRDAQHAISTERREADSDAATRR